MPPFVKTVSDLRAEGPVVDLHIAIGSEYEEALKQANMPIPQPVPVVALIDTGAGRSIIGQGIAAQLGLSPVGTGSVNIPSLPNVEGPEYRVRFIFPNGTACEGTMLELPIPNPTIQCLIGRDFLAHTVFVYVGQSNLFTISL